MNRNNEWNVYVEGKYVGTVHADNESDARCAALSEFDAPENASISVMLR